MWTKNKRTLTEKERKVAVDILEDVIALDLPVPDGWYDKIMERYDLTTDPFNGLPCTWAEYVKRNSEYKKQVMFEKYGHWDGVE